MNLKLKEKNEDESIEKKSEQPKRTGRSIAELASLSTLSEEELEEANAEDEDEFRDEFVDGEEEEDYEGDGDEYEEDEESEDAEEENDPPMEHYGKQFSFIGRPSPEDVFRFLFHHTYFSVIGVIAILLLISSVVMAVWSFMDYNLIQGMIFTVIFLFLAINSPLSLKKRSKKQSANMCSEDGQIVYNFSEAGFDMLRKKEYASYTYDKILKVIKGKTAYYVYLGKMRAFLAPKADLGENEELFVELIKEHVKNFKG